MELVSVVTPCYNAAPFVAETIAAVAAQSHPAVEHILVDDASTDRTWEILQEHGGRVVLLRSPANQGGAHARNRGLERARGEYFMFLDADDLIAPDTIAGLVSAVRDRPGTIGFCGWRRLGRAGGAWRHFPAESPLPRLEDDALRGWLDGVWLPPCALLWRRDTYQLTGGWDESLTMNDDADLMMRALARGARLVRAEGGEAYYRDHGGARLSVSTDLSRERSFHSRMRSYQKLADELEAQGRLNDYLIPLGRVFHRLALTGYREGYPSWARECLTLGERYAGHQAVSRSWLGRVLSGVIGLKRKEQLFNALAAYGLGRSERVLALRRRRLGRGGADDPDRHQG
jgi:glycosyltransferase involved in cell wall biosynthesis